MKILTIAGPRVGGKYFTKYLADEYGLTHHHEPILDLRLDTLLSNDDISVKLVTTHLYRYYHLDSGLGVEESVDSIYDRINQFKFDKIFLLDRYHTMEYIEALINLELRKGNNHVDWVYNEQFKDKFVTESKVEYFKTYAKESSRWIQLLSNKFKLPIIYYDDLYYNTKSVDLHGLHFNPDLSKKLRKNIPNSNKLL